MSTNPEQLGLGMGIAPSLNPTPTRRSEMEKAAEAFHLDNPKVWVSFCAFARSMLTRGYRRYSADAVMHRVRWETDLGSRPDSQQGVRFRISNNHVAFYARWFNRKHPMSPPFFAEHEQKSAEQAAQGDG